MSKKFVLFIGLLVCVILLESNVFALSFNVTTYDVGSQPDSVAVGDFNGDGKPDLAVANKGSNTVSILFGNGDGTFQAAVNYSVNSPQSVTVSDFNKDGNLDLAVARGSSNGVSILLGTANGTFQPAVTYNVNNPQSVGVGDFDEDGKLDLAVTRGSSNGVSILLGTVNGTFLSAVTYNAGTDTVSVAVDDFNKDGKLDLAVANRGSDSVSILLGTGNGTFQSAVDFSVNNPQSVVAPVKDDFNRDGKPDLAVANPASNTISVLLGNGNGTFQTAVTYNTGTNPVSVAVDDFDGDGKLDLAVANSGNNTVSILLGKGDGTFQEPDNFTVETNPLSVAVDDFNGDGKPDLVVSNSDSNTVSILLNTTSLVTVPGAPTGVSAKAGDAQAIVSFTAPASDGGSPITLYTVTSSPGSFSGTGASSPITVTGLTNGTAYTFTVRATNAIGIGPASAPSNSIIPGPIISVSPMSVNFGPVRVGSSSGPKTVTIKSAGNVDLIINSVSIAGANQAEFTQTNNCSTVPAKGSCSIAVTFAPAMPFGKETAILSISSNDPRKPTVNVQLVGLAAPPKISALPKSINFGLTRVNSVSTPKIITIKNTGISDLIINSITVAGTNATEFIQDNDCSTIAKGSSCAITVTFSPASTGKKDALIAISSNDPKKPIVNVKLLGQGAPPKISVVPKSINFGSTQVNNISTPKIVTIKNTGISDLIINSITVTGTNATEFIQDNDCSTIAKGSSCAITVTFSPASTGKKDALIAISSNDPKKPTINVHLSGKGRT